MDRQEAQRIFDEERATGAQAKELARAHLLLLDAVAAHRRERYGNVSGWGGVYAIDGRLYQAAGIPGQVPPPQRRS